MNKFLLLILLGVTLPAYGMEPHGHKRSAEGTLDTESALKKQLLQSIANSLRECYSRVGIEIPQRVESPQPQEQPRTTNIHYTLHDCFEKLIKHAQALYKKGSYEQAQEILSVITDLQEGTLVLQGKTAAKLGDFKKAQENFRHAITNFNSVDALRKLLRLYAQDKLAHDDFSHDNLKTVIAHFEKEHPTHARLFATIGDYYVSLSIDNPRLIQKAISYLEKSCDNGNKKAYYKLGNVYYKRWHTSRSNKKQNLQNAMLNYNHMIEALAKKPAIYSSAEKSLDIRRKCEAKIKDLQTKSDNTK